MKDLFKNCKKYWNFCCYSAYCHLSSDISGMRFGWLWWVAEPLLFMAVYTVVFSVVFNRNMTYLMAYISCGLMMWNFFQRCVLNSVSLVKHYSGLLHRVYIPKYILIFSTLLYEAFKMFISFMIVMVFMVYYRIPLSFTTLQFIPVLVTFFLFTFGCCVWLLHLGVYLPDIKKITSVCLKVLFYLSGVFFSLDNRIKGDFGSFLLRVNPVGRLLHEARNALLYNTNISVRPVALIFVMAVILSVSGIFVVTRYEQHYIKVS